MIVVDASVVVPAIADGGSHGDICRDALKGHVLAAPDLLRVEALSAVRRLASSGALTARQAGNAINDLLDLPISTYPTAPFLRRCWELPAKVTAYDACYVAVAEELGVTLLTADAKLANSPGPRCRIQLL